MEYQSREIASAHVLTLELGSLLSLIVTDGARRQHKLL